MKKTSLFKIIPVAAFCAALLVLSACGGGDSDGTSSSASTSALKGTYLTQCFAQPYGAFQVKSVFTNTSGTVTGSYYNNATCDGTPVATVTRSGATYSTQGTKSVTGPSGSLINATKLLSPAHTNTLTHTGSVSVDSSDPTRLNVFVNGTEVDNWLVSDGQEESKDLVYLDGNKLYGSDSDSAQDSDGYPTALDLTYFITKQ